VLTAAFMRAVINQTTRRIHPEDSHLCVYFCPVYRIESCLQNFNISVSPAVSSLRLFYSDVPGSSLSLDTCSSECWDNTLRPFPFKFLPTNDDDLSTSFDDYRPCLCGLVETVLLNNHFISVLIQRGRQGYDTNYN
jgi:hypothetical protein